MRRGSAASDFRLGAASRPAAGASVMTPAAGAWGVLLLFTVPIGGGIPAGVVLAAHHGIGWPVMLALYFVSDVILACVFEPLMNLLIAAGRKVPALGRVGDAVRRVVRQSAAGYGSALGPLALILIAFGVDPMTGRAASHAAGHGFVSGWALAITGDMMYFTVLMVSTLWLNSVLGDGTLVTVVMLAAMFIVPALLRRWSARAAQPGG